MVAVGGAVMLGSCCVIPPHPGRYFDRWQSPEQTLKGFVYAIETGYWDYAYECLTAETRNEIGRFKFEAVIRWASDPAFHEVPIYEVIKASILVRSRPVIEGRQAWIKVAPTVTSSDGVRIVFPAKLYFSFDAGSEEWLFDFLGTLQGVPGAKPLPE